MQRTIVTQCVQLLLEAFPDLLAIYVFGSFGTKYETAESYLDIAILPLRLLNEVELWRLAQDLAEKIRRDVEVIDLLRASTVFRFQVITTSTRVYCSDPKQCDAIENTYLSMYLRLNEERAEIIQDKLRNG